MSLIVLSDRCNEQSVTPAEMHTIVQYAFVGCLNVVLPNKSIDNAQTNDCVCVFFFFFNKKQQQLSKMTVWNY